MSDDAYEIRQKTGETCRGCIQQSMTVYFTPKSVYQPVSGNRFFNYNMNVSYMQVTIKTDEGKRLTYEGVEGIKKVESDRGKDFVRIKYYLPDTEHFPEDAFKEDWDQQMEFTATTIDFEGAEIMEVDMNVREKGPGYTK